MKNFNVFLLILFSVLFLFNGCDSPSGSKPDAVTKPALVSPTDNAANVTLTPTFTWTGSADILEIALNPTFNPVLYSASVSGESYKLPQNILTKDKRYYWHAGKKSGSDVFWSTSIFSFSTIP